MPRRTMRREKINLVHQPKATTSMAVQRSLEGINDRENPMTTTMPLTTFLRNRVARIRNVVVAAIAAAGAIFVASGTLAQEQTAATPADAIIARKTVMDSLSDKMDDIEGAISAGKVNLDTAHANADTISVFLMAFPHLFPAATNQWKPGVDRDPATDTFASPDLWTKFGDFYKKASDASKSAYNASRAGNENELKAAIAQLRTECNGCHAAYMKTN